MSIPRSTPRHIQKPAVLILLLAGLCGGGLFLPEGRSQAPANATANASLAPLLAKLKAQQDLMNENQHKIEAQTATLKEELRQAKIYAARFPANLSP